MHLKIKQALNAFAFNGEERGLPLPSAGFVRIIVQAPVGQTLSGDFTVKLALRHGATGLLLPFSTLATVYSGTVMGQRGVVAAEVPVRGNEGDELVACVAGASTSGTPLDVELDTGYIYLTLEALPAS